MPDKNMISRRSLLERVPLAAATAVSLYCLTAGGAAAQQDKMNHALSKYQDTPKNGQQCSTCTHFVAPASCAIVVDPIAPEGWCQFYVKP
jgi:hypothetical protein